MQKSKLLNYYLVVSMFIILLLGCLNITATAQAAGKLQEHEVIDIANGMKLEVIRFRGEGDKEEAEVIYFTDKRQTGTRKWEPTSKVLELKRASQMLKEATKVASAVNKKPVTNTENNVKTSQALPQKKVPAKDTIAKKVVVNSKPVGKTASPFVPGTNNTGKAKAKIPVSTHINEVAKDSYTLSSVEKKQPTKAAASPTTATSVNTPAVKNNNPAGYVNPANNAASTKQPATTSAKPTITKAPTTNTAVGSISNLKVSIGKDTAPKKETVVAAPPPKQAPTEKPFTATAPLNTGIISKAARADTGKVRVAVFAPIYLDDMFTGTTYNLGKTVLPKNVLPGLEFYNGVMLAVDSLSKEGANVEVTIYDTKQALHSLAETLTSPQLNNIGLIIAAITNTTELKQFSQFALNKNIPLISATFPNTVGVNGNPFFVLLNSSFAAHLEGLYKHMQRYYASNTIIAVKQVGTKEDYIKNYITALNKNTRSVPLSIKWIELKPGFTAFDLTKNLDSTKNNVVFVASPLESFGLDVVRALNFNESYHCTAIGMPTWDGIRELNDKNLQNVEIVYSTPFIYTSNNFALSTELVVNYREKYFSRPSDMVYKGFETMYHFTKLLTKYRYNLINNLSDKEFTLFNQFDIQPVKIKSSNLKPDYLENKKLYYIKKQQGIIKNIL